MGSHSHEQERARSSTKQVSPPIHHSLLQRRDTSGNQEVDLPRATISPIIKDALEASGQPLDTDTRTLMESRFGHDFSNVRVHHDTQAGESAATVHSLAYTIGQNIVFGAGQYAPRTTEGRRLLAHELTHVVQQKKANGNSLTGNTINQSSDPAEHEAEHVAQTIVRGGHAPQVVSMGRGMQRDDGGVKAPAASKLLDTFETKFPDAAKLIRSNKPAMDLVNEAEAAGAKFGGYAEDGPGHRAWPYTDGNTVYVPKASTDKMTAMKGFLFELNNAIRKPKFEALNVEASKGSKGTLNAKDYAYKVVEQEVEGMVRLGEVWFETKKANSNPKEWDKYDNEFYLSEYQAFKAKKKSKDDIVKNVLKRVRPHEPHAGWTVEQYYMDAYKSLAGGK
jgi:Domain of unknown function (DUF4157)